MSLCPISPKYPAIEPKMISIGAIGILKIFEKYGDVNMINAKTISMLSPLAPSVCKIKSPCI